MFLSLFHYCYMTHFLTLQMTDLAAIARCVATTNLTEEGATEYLAACMQDLQDNLQHSKFEALIVDTFGRLVEKLLRYSNCSDLCAQR